MKMDDDASGIVASFKWCISKKAGEVSNIERAVNQAKSDMETAKTVYDQLRVQYESELAQLNDAKKYLAHLKESEK